ncbi:hypothetical protein ACPXB5_11365 [Micromonospora arida]|uniref:hypothetical protein n=1 Tax=Micromonospora arida TaxID=2203715 RepID=UPI003CE7693A
MMATDSSEATITGEIVRRLRALRGATDRERRTTLAREVATLAVDLREHYLVDGRPDYAGRSHAYLSTMRDLWSKAGYTDADERDRAQAQVRYHVGNIVRDRIPADDLEAAGLQTPSPRGQSNTRHRARSALAVAATSAPIGDTDADLVRAVGAALAILQRLETDRVAVLDGRERRLVVAALSRIEDRAAALRGAADAEESNGRG